MRRSPRPRPDRLDRPRSRSSGVVAAVAACSALARRRADASAQTTPPVTPFPRPIMAFVPADRVAAATAVDPALAVQSVAVAAGDGIGSDAEPGGHRRVRDTGHAARRAPTGCRWCSATPTAPAPAPRSRPPTANRPAARSRPAPTVARWTSAGATERHPRRRLAAHHRRRSVRRRPGQGLWVEAQIGDDAGPPIAVAGVLARRAAGAQHRRGVRCRPVDRRHPRPPATPTGGRAAGHPRPPRRRSPSMTT